VESALGEITMRRLIWRLLKIAYWHLEEAFAVIEEMRELHPSMDPSSETTSQPRRSRG